MKESHIVDTFMASIMGLINQMKSHGEDISDRMVVEKILNILPSRCNSFDDIATLLLYHGFELFEVFKCLILSI